LNADDTDQADFRRWIFTGFINEFQIKVGIIWRYKRYPSAMWI